MNNSETKIIKTGMFEKPLELKGAYLNVCIGYLMSIEEAQEKIEEIEKEFSTLIVKHICETKTNILIKIEYTGGEEKEIKKFIAELEKKVGTTKKRNIYG